MRLIVHKNHKSYLDNPTIQGNMAYVDLHNKTPIDMYPYITKINEEELPYICEPTKQYIGFNSNMIYRALEPSDNITEWLEQQLVNYKTNKVNKILNIRNSYP